MRAHYADVWQAVSRAVPDRIAMRTTDEEWTYKRFTRDAGALAATLTGDQIRAGDSDAVAMLLYNRPEFLVAMYAGLATGITPVPFNFRLRAREVADLLDDSEARVMIYPTSLVDVAVEAAELAAGHIHLIAVQDDDTTDAPGIAWADAIANDGELPAAPDNAEMWIYTGGTTGRPKAVRWDEQDMFGVQMFATYSLVGLDYPTTVAEAARIAADPATPHVVNLPLAPFMHGTALTTSMNTLTVGGTVLVTSSARFNPEQALQFANEAGATRIIVAGDAVALPLVEAAERDGIELPTVTSVMSSGMRFSPEVKRRLHALGDLSIFDLLASTEGGLFAITTTTGVDDAAAKPQLVPTAAVLDEDHNDVKDTPGATGILAQSGPLPIGYHRDPEKTAQTFPVINGTRYVMPGDMVRVEEDQYIEFLGRGSGVINTGGEKVYPIEVEEALLSHPAVSDAVVIGVPDQRFGELVSAVVVPGADVTVAELGDHVNAQLAGYKRPRHILFRDTLDRSPTGKVNMAALRDEVAADRAEHPQ